MDTSEIISRLKMFLGRKSQPSENGTAVPNRQRYGNLWVENDESLNEGIRTAKKIWQENNRTTPASPSMYYGWKTRFDRAVEGLDDELKIPFRMLNEGYEYGEIAKRLHTNIHTVKGKIKSARNEVKNRMSENM